MKTKKLFDLYVVGKEHTVTDGENSETVWIQKLNQNEHENAYRRANAKRAVFLAKRKNLNDDEILALKGEYEAVFEDRDAMVEFLVNDNVARIVDAREAELAAEDEWAKDNYYQGLLDSWNDGLRDSYHMGEDDPENTRYEEAVHVYEEMTRFTDKLEEKIESERQHERKELEDWSLERLDETVTKKLIEAEADSRWLNEYKLSEIFHAVREQSNHRKNYFEARSDIDELPLETLVSLLTAYSEISIGLVEGKD